MLINDLTFAGNSGADARDGQTTNGTRVVSFSLAHTEKGKDGRQDTVTWVRVKVFGGWCDFAAGVKKGENILVKGKLNVASYEDKDGNARTSVDVVPFAMARIAREESRAQQGQGQQRGGQRAQSQSQEPMGLDDIPF